MRILSNRIFLIILFLVMSVILLLAATPTALQGIPGRDSGIFLHIGQSILDGQVPYRDVWDHKPPLIYFIDALALGLFPFSFWGVWIVSVIFLVAAFLFGYNGLSRVYPNWLSLFGICLAACQLPLILEDGNFTEFYALAFQFAAIFCITNKDMRFRLFFIGLSGGLTFVLRQNLIGLWLVFGVVLIWQAIQEGSFQKFIRDMTVLSSGVLLPIFIIGLWFAWHGALDELWEAAFLYNFAYITESEYTLWELVTSQLTRGLFIFMPLMWLVAGVALWRQRNPSTLHVIAVILFPLDVFFATLSGRNFGHYYLLWLPLLALLAVVSLNAIWQVPAVRKLLLRPMTKTSRLVIGHYIGIIIGTTIAVWICLFIYAFFLISASTSRAALKQQYQTVKAYLDDNLADDAAILVWGADAYVHDYTGYPAVSRFVYQYPLARAGYANAEDIQEFLHDLQTQPPTIILDTSNTALPALNPDLRGTWQLKAGYTEIPEMAQILNWIDAHYIKSTCFDLSWCIYRYQPED